MHSPDLALHICDKTALKKFQSNLLRLQMSVPLQPPVITMTANQRHLRNTQPHLKEPANCFMP